MYWLKVPHADEIVFNSYWILCNWFKLIVKLDKFRHITFPPQLIVFKTMNLGEYVEDIKKVPISL